MSTDDLLRTCSHAREVGRELKAALDRAREADADHTCAVEIDRASELLAALDFSLDDPLLLHPILWRDRHRTRSIAAVLDGTRDLGGARALVSELARARQLTDSLGGSLHRDRSVGNRRRQKARRVAPSAAGVLAAATRLLPTADRARYAEEYHSELWELAQDDAGRLRQVRYALRQLWSALPTGFALRSPRRKGAAP